MESKLLNRNKISHKGDYGRLGIIGGSVGMAGSIYLASMAGLKTGAGLVYTIIPSSLLDIMSIKLVEPIIRPVRDKARGHLVKESLDDLLEAVKDLDVLAVGPGMGLGEDRIYIMEELIKNLDIPMVVDADGINCISKNKEMLKNKKSEIIITPHMMEMSRFTGVDIEKLEENKEYYIKNTAEKYGINIVLKGHHTMICTRRREKYINFTGNPGMATAGSGDVLTGIIGGLLAQGFSVEDAMKTGVYMHGLAGDMASEEKSEYGIIASDILENIPYVF